MMLVLPVNPSPTTMIFSRYSILGCRRHSGKRRRRKKEKEKGGQLRLFRLLFELLGHDENDEGGPASEGVASLSPSTCGIILLPQVSRPRELREYRGNNILAKGVIDPPRLLLVRALHPLVVRQRGQRHVVNVDPNGPSPVWAVMLLIMFLFLFLFFFFFFLNSE